MTKLGPKLPDDHGLSAIARALVDRPHEPHAVIAIIDTKKITTDTDDGTAEATARIRRIEVIDGADLALAEKVMRRALEKRTGQTTLPIDLEDEIADVFRNVDPSTGEIRDKDE